MAMSKEIMCYCWLDTEIAKKDDGTIEHNGGECMATVLNEGTSMPQLLAEISREFHIDPLEKVMKYTMKFNPGTLVNFGTARSLKNLVQYNDDVANLYLFSTSHSTNQQEHVLSTSNNNNQQQVSSTATVVATEPTPTCPNIDNENTVEEVPALQMSAPCIDSPSCSNSNLYSDAIIGPGQVFMNPEQFREALYRFSVGTKFEYKYVKNNRQHINVKCAVTDCPWKLTANCVGQTEFMVVGTFNNKHQHSVQDIVDFQPRKLSKYNATIMEGAVRLDPRMSAREICNFMHSTYKLNMSYKQGWRCKELALKLIDGNADETYKLLPWLCDRLRDADPDTIAICDANDDSTFLRLFVAYGCSINGFVNGCRPIVFIDACHLSGPYRGTLLAASSLDADNRLYPLAYGVVGGETYDNWYWFLNILSEEIIRQTRVVIISDRNNSILEGVAQVFGRDRHAYCYRHVKENFSVEVCKYFRGKKRKGALELLDAVTYGRLESDYVTALGNLRTLSIPLAAWVEDNEPERWVMSKFPHKRWDKITTNLAESLNAWLKKERCLPILSFVNQHREKLAKKLNKVKNDMSKWKSIVGGNIEDKLKENVRIGELFCTVSQYSTTEYKVHIGAVDLRVDMLSRSCTCLAWDMSGLPCCHACAVIKHTGENIYSFVDKCYHKETQEMIYSKLMIPVETHMAPEMSTDGNTEHEQQDIDLLPPVTKRPPGRPKVKRKESQFIQRRPLHCSLCGVARHNRRNCKIPNPSPANPPNPI